MIEPFNSRSCLPKLSHTWIPPVPHKRYVPAQHLLVQGMLYYSEFGVILLRSLASC